MLYVAHFGFSFKFLGGQKMTLPFLDFSRLFACPLYALGEPNNTEKVNVAICSHFFLDWLAYLVLLLQKYKNAISARRTYLQPSHPVFHNPERKWQFQFGYYPKIYQK